MDHFGRKRRLSGFGQGGAGLAALRRPALLRRFSWIPLVLAILSLSAVLAAGSLWLLRGEAPRPGSPTSAEAPAPIATSTAAASPGSRTDEGSAAESGAKTASRADDPPAAGPAFTASPPLPKSEIASGAAALAPSPASAGQPTRVASASADLGLSPERAFSPSRPEPTAPRATAPPATSAGLTGLQPGPPAMPSEESQRLAARASGLLKQGDIAGARLLLARAASTGGARVAFALAETYDPKVLASWKVRGIKPDPEKAKALYRQAAEGGLPEARGRLEALR